MSIFGSFGSKGAFARSLGRRTGFFHSVLSFTRLEVPALECFETAVVFPPQTDPIAAHKELAAVFGQKAGEGEFLFRADTATAGRYWVQSAAPWPSWPAGAISALEPKRVVIQLAEGLMYRFALAVCAGRATIKDGEKIVEPYMISQDVEAWLRASAPRYGFTPLMFDVSMQTLCFAHRGHNVRIGYAQIEGALEVAEPEQFKRRLMQGFGHHRRAGLGLMQLVA